MLKTWWFFVLFLTILHLEVIWYSWSSNWGGDFYGGVRISLPDPASSSVVQGYIQYPNGTLAVDYPEVVLVKLIKKTLFEIPGDVKTPFLFFLVSEKFFFWWIRIFFGVSCMFPKCTSQEVGPENQWKLIPNTQMAGWFVGLNLNWRCLGSTPKILFVADSPLFYRNNNWKFCMV